MPRSNNDAARRESRIVENRMHGLDHEVSPRLCKARFTLVELLIVCAVISILASLLIPALRNSINHARCIICMNNMKQAVLSTMTFIQDNAYQAQPVHWAGYQIAEPDTPVNDYLYFVQIAAYSGLGDVNETAAVSGTDSRWWRYWKGCIPGGAIRKSIMFCPSEKYENAGAAFYDHWVNKNLGASYWGKPTSYGPIDKNWHIAGQEPDLYGGCPSKGVTTTNVENWLKPTLLRSDKAGPSNLAIYGEQALAKAQYTILKYLRINNGVNPAYPEDGSWNSVGGWLAFAYNTYATHNNSLNFGFLDGHVQLIPWEDILDESKYKQGGDTPIWETFAPK